jgi:hypothetical protein
MGRIYRSISEDCSPVCGARAGASIDGDAPVPCVFYEFCPSVSHVFYGAPLTSGNLTNVILNIGYVGSEYHD